MCGCGIQAPAKWFLSHAWRLCMGLIPAPVESTCDAAADTLLSWLDLERLCLDAGNEVWGGQGWRRRICAAGEPEIPLEPLA